MNSSVQVHADQALLVDESNANFLHFEGRKRSEAINNALAMGTFESALHAAVDVTIL